MLINPVYTNGKRTIVPLDAPSSFVANPGNAQITLTWTDPENETTSTGQTVATWQYTKVLRKTGSQPSNDHDGELVVLSSVKNQYQTTGYVDEVANGQTYYYAAFAYSVEGGVSEGAFVSAEPVSYDPVLENNSWAQISAASEAGMGSSLWAIGDTHSLTINGQVGTQTFNNYATFIFIIGFDHNAAVEGEGITFQGFKSAGSGGRDLCLVGPNYGNWSTWTSDFCMNNNGSNSGGWNGCNMRNVLLGSQNASSPASNSLMAALPADLRTVLRPMTIWTNNSGGNNNTASATTDYLPLLGEFEIFGATTYSCSAEAQHQQQYTYYASGNSKVKYRHDSTGSAASWWERSPRSGYATYFCIVAADGNAGFNFADFSFGVAPALRI